MGIIKTSLLVIFFNCFCDKVRILQLPGFKICLTMLLEINITIEAFLSSYHSHFFYTALNIIFLTVLVAFAAKKTLKVEFQIVIGSKDNIY